MTDLPEQPEARGEAPPIEPVPAPARPTHLVGIGASAGGIEALEHLVQSLPEHTGMAFVILQHLAPDFASLMDQVLARHTRLPVRMVREDTVVAPDTLYLLPEATAMVVQGQTLRLVEIDRTEIPKHPIDRFFFSLAEQWGDRAVAVVLSGTGSDGSRGVRAVHEAGGMVIAQTSRSAAFPSMPHNAVATGVVDHVLAPEHIPRALLEHRGRDAADVVTPYANEMDDPIYGSVFALLRAHCGIDFNHYKLQTVERRVERRMADCRLHTVPEFTDYLATHRDELDRLYRDLLIGVTAFFRDAAVWQYVEEELVPTLLERGQANGELRIWTPGCATGEEVYSLAMLLREEMSRRHLPLPLKIFATDVHQPSLDTAANGIYTEEQLASVAPERIERHFTPVTNGFMVRPELRKMVVFARQDVTRDPPFTRVDFVICRNLLIYLSAEAQQKVLAVFHFALNKDGFLLLGPSESLGDIAREFGVVDARHKVFARRTEHRVANAAFTLPSMRRPIGGVAPSADRSILSPRGTLAGRPISLIRAYDVLMEQYMPPSLLVSDSGEVAHTFGNARRYLQPQAGVASLFLSDMIHPDLRLAVISAMHRLQTGAESVRYTGIVVAINGETRRVNLVVRPLLQQGAPTNYLIFTFEESTSGQRTDSESAVEVDYDPAPGEHLHDLETELRYTKEHLQSAVEDLETSNEELQATNEELMAANEELQSTNEELHSVNEELYTVNREYELKIEEFTRLNSDVDNLLASAEIGTLFLDHELRIRKFTPAAAAQFNLLDQDIGRPINHLQRHIRFPAFHERLAQVLSSGELFESEVEDRFGRGLLMRISAYCEPDGTTTGVVVAFVDVERLMQASRRLQTAEQRLQEFASSVAGALQGPARTVGSVSLEFSHALAEHLSTGQQASLVQAADAADRITRMVTALRQYVDVGRAGREEARTSSAFACYEALRILNPLVRAAGARVEVGELPEVWGDRDQLTLLFRHLIENAVTHAQGQVSVVVHCESADRFLTFSVRDDGPGMTPDALARALTLFGTSGGNGGGTHDGLGAGLPICKRIAERHGGHLWVESQAGSGTTVFFTLPVVR